MRGFDKGKFLDDGGLRPTHVADYLATIEQDPAHNELSRHIRKPQVVAEADGGKTESLFRTAHFNTDRLTVSAGASLPQSLADGFHHLFVHAGTATVGGRTLAQGRSYVLPALAGRICDRSRRQRCGAFEDVSAGVNRAGGTYFGTSKRRAAEVL